MRWMALLGLMGLSAACGPVDQTSVQTVAAIEVELRDPSDRRDLVAMFRRHPAGTDLHVDDMTDRWRSFEAESNMLAPTDRGTFYVSIWRGAEDDEEEVSADDRYHPGRVWITFPRGTQPERSTRIRERLLADIRRRWPNARPLPVLPWGGLPHASDLVMTERGYRIRRGKADSYELDFNSPLLENAQTR